MKYRRAVVVVVVSVLVVVSRGAAGAAIQGVSFGPMSPYWQWENPPIHGQPSKIIETSFVPNASGKLGENFQCEYDFVYEAGRLSGENCRYVDGKPLYSVLFDQRGGRMRVSWSAVEPPSRQPVSRVETAHFDAAGRLIGFTIARDDGVTIEIPVAATYIDGGGVSIKWSNKSGNREDAYTLAFDAKGELTGYSQEVNGRPFGGITTLSYDGQQNVIAVDSTLGRMHHEQSYVYEYDTQDNWTKRTEYSAIGRGGDISKQLIGVVKRQIPYLAESQVAVGGGQSSGRADERLAGTYRAQVGDAAGGRFFSSMVLELKGDGSATLTNTMPTLDQPSRVIQNKAEGHWKRSGTSVVVTLESSGGVAIAADDPQRTLTLTVAGDGKHLEGPGGTEFSRQ